SDFSMPQFNGRTALAIARESRADIPFIFISGTIGENVAVDMMKAGANDYVMKNNLARLLPALKRELREAEVRRARRLAEERLKESEAGLHRAQVMAKLASGGTGPGRCRRRNAMVQHAAGRDRAQARGGKNPPPHARLCGAERNQRAHRPRARPGRAFPRGVPHRGRGREIQARLARRS